jgi:hypothetical protein
MSEAHEPVPAPAPPVAALLASDGIEKNALASYLPATVLNSIFQMQADGRRSLPQSDRCALDFVVSFLS